MTHIFYAYRFYSYRETLDGQHHAAEIVERGDLYAPGHDCQPMAVFPWFLCGDVCGAIRAASAFADELNATLD